jgi:hypothetical protein
MSDYGGGDGDNYGDHYESVPSTRISTSLLTLSQ